MPISIFATPLAFVDVETTGTSYTHGGIIDIGVVRVEDGQITQTFEQLVNPGSSIPAFITQLTGITNDQLADAPYFGEIAPSLKEILDGCIFVAHNVRFDYAFIKEEFRRVGQLFSPKQLCTVKLSRELYPEQHSHKLASLIERFGLQPDVRHRAFADAHVTWQALQKMVEQKGQERVEAAAKLQLRRPTIPAGIKAELLNNLPEGPGVYIFEGESGATLYVGKSVNIKQRVLSHFADDHRIAKELRMAQEIAGIRTIPTSGELGALLKESELIKTLLPIHNRMLRRKSELVLAVRRENNDGYPTLELERYDADEENNHPDLSNVMAVFKSFRQAKESLISLAKQNHLCHKLLGLQKTSGACFMHQLKVCYGACVGKESALDYTLRLDQAFSTTRLHQWPYQHPILITEKSADMDQSSGVIVDQWCIIGRVEQNDQHIDVTTDSPSFDLDHYKILKRFIENPKNRANIRILGPKELHQLHQSIEA